MVTQTIQQRPHPYFTQFAEWAQFDPTTDQNYYTVNSALWAAQQYINQRFGLMLFATNESINMYDVLDNITYSKLLSVRKDSTVLLPKTSYYDTTSNTWVNTAGDYQLKNGQFYSEDAISYSQPYSNKSDLFIQFDYVTQGTSDMVANIVNGWVLQESPFTRIEDTSVGTTGVATPYVTTTSNVALEYPTFTRESSIDVVVHGTPDTKVIINETDTGIVIDSSGIATVTCDTSLQVNSIRIRLQNSTSWEYSTEVKLLFIQTTTDVQPNLVLLDHDKITNSGTCSAIVYTNVAGTVNGQSVQIGTNTITITVTGNTTPLVLNTAVGDSETVYMLCKFDEAASNNYVQAINGKLQVPLVPQDLLMAFYRVAYHFFQEAIGKNDQISRYSADTGQAITFNGHRLPKDVVAILSSHMVY